MNNSFSLEQTAKTSGLNAESIVRQYKVDKMAKLMEIKSINRKLKQSEIAREVKISSPTLQQNTGEIKMLSSYRIPPSSNTQRRKQKTSNQTEHDFKMTSNDRKMTSNEPVKYKKNKLKGGMPNDNPTQRSVLIEQAFSSPLND